MDERIEITSHVENMMESLGQIFVDHISDEFLYLYEDALYIHNLLCKIPDGENKVICEIKFSNKKMVGIDYQEMYTPVVEAIVENDIYKILKTSPM